MITAEQIAEIEALREKSIRVPRHLNTPFMNALEDAATDLLAAAKAHAACIAGCTWFQEYQNQARTQVQTLQRAEKAEAELDTTQKEAARSHERYEELWQTFEIRRKADRRAEKKWHVAGGDKLTSPDHADLCVWLMGQLDAAQKRIADLEKDIALDQMFERERAESLESLISSYLDEATELPDRTSPDEYPDMLLIHPDELRQLLRTFTDEIRALDQGE